MCRRPISAANKRQQQVSGAYFILQMHDELLYEVEEIYLAEIANLIKKSMEEACKLSVKTPAKLKYGPSWGSLQPFEEILLN